MAYIIAHPSSPPPVLMAEYPARCTRAEALRALHAANCERAAVIAAGGFSSSILADYAFGLMQEDKLRLEVEAGE